LKVAEIGRPNWGKKVALFISSVHLLICLPIIFLEVLTVFAQQVHGQSRSQGDSLEVEEINRENTLESVMSYSDDVSEIFARVDLNAATTEDLLSIPGMTSGFASSIVAYRRRVNFIHTFDELSVLDGATSAVLSSLRAYAEIVPDNDFTASFSSYSGFSPEKAAL
jgi:hypothetical protein